MSRIWVSLTFVAVEKFSHSPRLWVGLGVIYQKTGYQACPILGNGLSILKEYVLSCSVMSDSLCLWTVACQAPLSVGFSRQESWSGVPFPSPGDLPDPGIELTSPALAGGFFTAEPPGMPPLRLYTSLEPPGGPALPGLRAMAVRSCSSCRE